MFKSTWRRLFVQICSNPHGEDDEEDGEEDSAHVEEEDTEQEAEERRCPEIFGLHAMSNNRKISILTDMVIVGRKILILLVSLLLLLKIITLGRAG